MVLARISLARVLVLMTAALYVAHWLGLGDPFGVCVLDHLFVSLFQPIR